MPSPTRLIVRGAPLPTNFKGTLNKFYKAMLDRLEVLSPFGQLQFQIGGVQPTSNVGPWLKGGTEWWVWDESLKTYVPITVPAASITAALATALAAYYTSAQVDTLLGGYATNAALSAAIAGVQLNTYPARAEISVTPQSFVTDGVPVKIVWETASINPAPAPFNVANSRYIAPVNGIYSVSVWSQFDNNSGNPAIMEVGVGIYVDDLEVGIRDLDSTPSPNGARWSPGFGGQLVQVNAGSYIEIFGSANDGGVAAVDLTAAAFSIVLVKVL